MTQAATINDIFVSNILTMRASVYTRVAGGGFTNSVKTGLACYLEAASRAPTATAAERRELASRGILRYDATYTFPAEASQVVVDAYPDKRWNTEMASAWSDILPGIGVVGKTVEMVRAV